MRPGPGTSRGSWSWCPPSIRFVLKRAGQNDRGHRQVRVMNPEPSGPTSGSVNVVADQVRDRREQEDRNGGHDDQRELHPTRRVIGNPS